MLLVDTHTHLYSEDFDSDRAQIIAHANAKGIMKFFLPNIDTASIPAMKKLIADFPEQCFGMMGLHPCSVKEDYLSQLEIIKQELQSGTYIAVGEIGMDLYWDKTFEKEQGIAFRMQLDWAIERKLPISIHCRNAFDEIYAILLDYEQAAKNQLLRGIFHCFSGNLEQANRIIDLGFYLGIGGVLTFKNSGLDKVVMEIPLDKLVLETDSPYLAPAPHRGKRNESEYLYLVAQKMAEIKNCTLQEVALQTTENAFSIFGKN